jgi:hypothetical protein
MCEALPPLPNTPSWRGAQLNKKSTGTTLPLLFTFIIRMATLKGKVVPALLTEHHAMKAYWGSEGVVPFILKLGTRWW